MKLIRNVIIQCKITHYQFSVAQAHRYYHVLQYTGQ